MGWLFFTIGLVLLWLVGFALVLSEIDLGPTVWTKLRRGLLVFFIWPYIAWVSITRGDI
jgi:hypothetical protein